MKQKYHILFLFAAILLSSCEKKELTAEEREKQQMEAIVKVHKTIAPVADEALLSDNPVEELKKVADQFKGNPEIETIEFETDKLALKYKNGGWVFWYINPWADVNENLAPRSLQKEEKQDSIIPNTLRIGETKPYPKILVINQISADKKFIEYNTMITEQISALRKEGYSIDYIPNENFDLKFCRKGLKGYDAVFITSHGCYLEEAKATWFVIGEKIDSSFSWNKELINHEVWKNALIAPFHIREKNNEEATIAVPYYAVSQNYFNHNYHSGDFARCVFYMSVCSGLTNRKNGFANAFVSRGAAKVIGYDNSTECFISTRNHNIILHELCYGRSYNNIYENLPRFIDRRKESYERGAQRHTFLSADGTLYENVRLVSYPTDTDFRFQILRLAKQDTTIAIVEKSRGKIPILSAGSGDYSISISDPQVATATIEKDNVTVTALKPGKTTITATDHKTKITASFHLLVQSKATHQANKIEDIIPYQYLRELKRMGMPIYEGITPPNVEGAYMISPCKCIQSNISGDSYGPGYIFPDAILRLYDQNNETFEIKIEEKQSDNLVVSTQTAISGTGNRFTVYGKVKSLRTNAPNKYAYFAYIYSGMLDANGAILNLTNGLICVENKYAQDIYIREGKERIVIDADKISPRTTWTTTLRSMPAKNGAAGSITEIGSKIAGGRQ